MTSAELWSAPLTYHGEGPVWPAREGALLWVDQLAGDILRSTDGSEVTRHHVGDVVAIVRARAAGGYVVALERSVAIFDADLVLQREVPLWSDPSVRLNEGGCDPAGRFYAGSMAYDARDGAAAMYRVGPDLEVDVVMEDLTVSNGLTWAVDGSVAYYVDSATQRIDELSFDPESGRVEQRRALVSIDATLGTPDGLTIDADGNLWVALWGGGAVHAYSPAGELLEVVDVAARLVSACTFGGDGYETLLITTSRFELSDPEPEAGAVFAASTGARGLPPLEFGG